MSYLHLGVLAYDPGPVGKHHLFQVNTLAWPKLSLFTGQVDWTELTGRSLDTSWPPSSKEQSKAAPDQDRMGSLSPLPLMCSLVLSSARLNRTPPAPSTGKE